MAKDKKYMPKKAEGTVFEEFMKRVEEKESSENPLARPYQKKAGEYASSAVGLHQFIPRYWDEFSKKKTGKTIEEHQPEYGRKGGKIGAPTKEDVTASAESQRGLFKKYYEDELVPQVKKLRESKDAAVKKAAADKTDAELMAMIHYVGAAGAAKQLKDPKSDVAKGAEAANAATMTHVRRIAEGIGQASDKEEPMAKKKKKKEDLDLNDPDFLLKSTMRSIDDAKDNQGKSSLTSQRPDLSPEEEPSAWDKLKGWAKDAVSDDKPAASGRMRADYVPATKTSAGRPAYTPEEREQVKSETAAKSEKTQQELMQKRMEDEAKHGEGKPEQPERFEKITAAGPIKATVDLDENKGKPEAVVHNLDSLEKQFDDLPEGTLSEEEKAKWDAEIKRIRESARTKMSALENAETAERLGHALSKMFAAMYGLRKGIDMSGVKFDKTDWGKRMTTAMALIDEELGAAKAGRAGAEKSAADARTRERQTLLDRFDRLREKRIEKGQKESGERWKKEHELRKRQTDISEGKVSTAAAQQKKKAADKIFKEAEDKYKDMDKQVNNIFGQSEETARGDENPKGTAEYKAAALSRLLGVNVTVEDLDLDKPGLGTGDWTWPEIKAKLYKKASLVKPTRDTPAPAPAASPAAPPSGGDGKKAVSINGKTFYMTQEQIDKMLADPSSKDQNIKVL